MSFDEKAYKRQYYLANKEKLLAQQKEYRINNKHRINFARKLEWEKRWRAENPDKVRRRDRISNRRPKGRFAHLRHRAKIQGWEITITFEEFLHLIKQPCFYCNGVLNETGGGLDRVDPTKGYLIDNVRPCCLACNQAKNDHTEQEFKQWITTVYKHYITKEQ